MRASSAAVHGRPTPMKTERAPVSSRAATIVCSSPVLAWVGSLVSVIAPPLLSSRSPGVSLRILQDMLLHPGGELVAVASEPVPEAVEVVVAGGDAGRVGRQRAAGRI